MAKFSAVVRKDGGPWEHRVEAATAREAKRGLAKKIGLPIRWADALPMGKTSIEVDEWSQVRVYERVRGGGWRQTAVNRMHRVNSLNGG